MTIRTLRRLGRLFCFLLLAAAASAQTVTVSGNLKELTGAPVSSKTRVRFYLHNCPGVPRVLGAGTLARDLYEFVPDANGVFSGTVYPNSSIDCGGAPSSVYRVAIFSDGAQKWFADFLIESNTDINTAASISTVPALPVPAYVRTNPDGAQTITGGLSAQEINNTPNAALAPGDDFCQKLNSSAKRTSTGIVDATGFTGDQTCSTNPFADIPNDRVYTFLLPAVKITSSATWEFGSTGQVVQKIRLIGAGWDLTGSNPKHGTTLVYTSSGAILRGLQIRSLVIERMNFEGNNTATKGIELDGVYFSRLADVSIAKIKCSDGTAQEPCAGFNENPSLLIDASGLGGASTYGSQNVRLDQVNARSGLIKIIGDPETTTSRAQTNQFDSVSASWFVAGFAGTLQARNLVMQPPANSTGFGVGLFDVSNFDGDIHIERTGGSQAMRIAPAVNTTVAAGISAGVNEVTPAGMTGIEPGDFLVIDKGVVGKGEFVYVRATTGTTFTANFANPHSAGFTVTRSGVTKATVRGGLSLAGGATALSGNPGSGYWLVEGGAPARWWDTGTPGFLLASRLRIPGFDPAKPIATTGLIQLPENFDVYVRNEADTANIHVLSKNDSDQLIVGPASGTTAINSQLSVTGHATFNGLIRSTPAGSAAAPQFTFTFDNDTGLFSGGTNSNVLGVAAGAAEVARFTGANGADVFKLRRFTDAAPSGNLVNFRNAADDTSLWRVDISGVLQAGTVPAARTSGFATVATTGAYSDLSSRTHALTGADHSASALTTGQPLRATGATSFAFGALDLANANAVTGTLPAARWSPLTAAGDLLYHDGSATTRLARGADGQCLTSTAASVQWGSCAGAGGGDNLSVNGAAATDADLDDATPAPPANAINVKWQKDALTPSNISAYLPYAAPLTVTGGSLALNQHAGTNVTADLEEEAHAAEHQHGGNDEIATATPAANAIPKAGAGGTLADGWLSANVSLLGSAIDAGELGSGFVDATTDISSSLCSANEILKQNGSGTGWTCAADATGGAGGGYDNVAADTGTASKTSAESLKFAGTASEITTSVTTDDTTQDVITFALHSTVAQTDVAKTFTADQTFSTRLLSTGSATANSAAVLDSTRQIAPSAAGQSFTQGSFYLDIAGANTNAITQLAGLAGGVDTTGAGAVTKASAGQFNAYHGGSVTTTSLYAFEAYTNPYSSGNTGTAAAVRAQVDQTGGGVITNAVGVSVASSTDTGAGSITNNYGVKIENQTAGASANYSIHTGSGEARFGDVVNTTVGYRVNGAAPAGEYLRGNGSNFVSSAIQSADLPAAARAETRCINLENPATADSGKWQVFFEAAGTAQRAWCSTDTGTVTMQWDRRANSTPNTAGASMLSASLVCDADEQATTSFASATIDQDGPIALLISATGGSPTVVRACLRSAKQ